MSFHFLRPEWFCMLLPLIWVCYRLMVQKAFNRSWARVVDARLLPHLLSTGAGQQRHWHWWLAMLCSLILIIALAGPTWKRLPMPVYQQQSALVILLDMSASMNATDLKPDRLQRVRLKLHDLLNARSEGQTALLVYAGDAYTVTPLTDDTETIRSLLPSLTTDIMPEQGSRTDRALIKALELFDNATVSRGDILLLTDGVDETLVETIHDVDMKSHQLSIIGVGSEEGAPVPQPEGGFLKDNNGAIVIAKTDHGQLRALASEFSGFYHPMTVDDSDITRYGQFLQQRLQSSDNQQTDFKADQWEEMGPWLLLPLIPLFALLFRRGWILTVLLALLLPMVLVNPATSHAQDTAGSASWWLTQDQQAYREWQQGNAASAAGRFQQPDWKAAALYQSGQYEQALQLMDKPASDSDFYNRGNALAKLGDYQQAIEQYDLALELNPENEDAAYNREQVKKAMQQQQQQQNDAQSDSQQQESQDGTSESTDSSSSDSSSQSSSGDDQQQGQSSSSQQPQYDPAETQDSGQTQADQSEKPQPESTQNDLSDQALAEAEQDQSSEQENANDLRAQQAQSTQDLSEQAQAQWLRRIPDNPGDLLRNKFLYQYSKKKRHPLEKTPW